MKKIKKFICKIFGHKYTYDSNSYIPSKLICQRCGLDNTISAIKEHINIQLNTSNTNNLKLIKVEIESGKIGGKWCTDGSKIGLVVGAVATIEDYYYVVLTPDEYKLQYWSCVGHIEPLNVEDNCYAFEKMFPKALIALTENQLEKNQDVEVLFTKLVVN